MREIENIAVIDASAIMLAKNNNLLGPTTIITPHSGEFERIEGISVDRITLKKRVAAAVISARNLKCTVVLKGNQTIITNGMQVKINSSKTPTLATMGSGDVLSGIIAAYCTLNKDPFQSAVAGVRLHSKIADELYKNIGLHIIAQDIVDKIPYVLKKFDVIAKD